MALRLSLKKWWTTLLLISVITPVIILMSWFGYQTYTTKLNHILQLEQQSNELLRDQINLEIKRLESVFVNKSDALLHLMRQKNQLSAINQFLNLIIQRETSVKGIILISKDAHVITAIDPYISTSNNNSLNHQQLQSLKSHLSTDLKNSPEFIIPLMGNNYIGNPHQHNNVMAFTMAVPIGLPSQAIMLVMLDSNKLFTKEQLQNKYNSFELTQSYLLDGRGVLLTQVEDSFYFIGDLMTHFEIVRTALINGTWQKELHYEGITHSSVYGTMTTISSLNWILVSEIDYLNIIYPIWLGLGQLFAIILFGLGAFIILLLFLANKTIQPIKALGLASKQIAQGNYKVTIHQSGIEELDSLIVNFNLMAQARQEADYKLERIAHYDVLTQLPNRMLLANRFFKALAYSQKQNKSLAICFLDLDNFKPVNDQYGHAIGDELLLKVSHRIITNLKENDTVSRQGGDEFALLINDIDSFYQCEIILKRIIKSLSNPYMIANHSITIGASIGITLYPEDNSDFDSLIRHADQAMYQAKREGRNKYKLFNIHEDQKKTEKIIRLKEIELALKNDELCLYYQPKANMKSGHVFGVEALIRWNHPEKGLLSPQQFLPIIEETELEIKVGNWIINTALQQLEQWDKQNIQLELSVNISAYHLENKYFIHDLRNTLHLYPHVSSHFLQLELLESSIFSDLKYIQSIMESCITTLGVSISLDDFGTGYSSLAHLRDLPAQTIKIDQSFIKNMLDQPRDYAIVESIIALAGSFNRNIIAEGVETTEHGLLLLVMGCQNIQGYHLARPMPAYKIPQWLSDYQPNPQWIAFAQTPHTQEELKKELFKLTFAQWQKNLEAMIQSLPEKNHYYLGFKNKECHCGIWLNRCRQEQLFNKDFFQKMEKTHDKLHETLDNFFIHYEAGEKTEAETLLTQLKDLMTSINQTLEEYQWFIS